jgi:hypothetical protein
MSNELEDRLVRMAHRIPEPSLGATARAREAALDALRATPAASRVRRAVHLSRRWGGAAIAVSAAGGIAALFAALIIATPTERPAAKPPNGAARSGIGATMVFRPIAGVTQDEAYAQMERVVRARLQAQKGVSVDLERIDSDRARVTVTGSREPTTIADAVAGSAIGIYDLDAELVGTFSSFRRAVLRARELAPDAPLRLAYLFRNGRLLRGPAPNVDALRRGGLTLPAGSEVLSLPEGYAILRRTYVRGSGGGVQGLRSALHIVVRNQPAVSPLEVTGAEWPRQGSSGITPALVGLTENGRREWDALLARVSARAASLGRPQRIAVTTNGDIEQVVTADAAGRLDKQPASPALEFDNAISGAGGIGLVGPTSTNLPFKGSIPAIVWVVETHRVGPVPKVLGERIEPVPSQIRRALRPNIAENSDLSTVRRALVADGPDGQWTVWNYLLTTGTPRSLVVGPRRTDGFGFGCRRMKAINDCGGGVGFQVFAVPERTSTLRFIASKTDEVLAEAVAANGWAMLLGPRRSHRVRPAGPITGVAVDEAGLTLAKLTGQFSLP